MNSDSAYRISRGKWYILILKLKLSDCLFFIQKPSSLIGIMVNYNRNDSFIFRPKVNAESWLLAFIRPELIQAK